MTPSVKHAVAMMGEMAARYNWFCIKNADVKKRRLLQEEDFSLPFDHCAVVAETPEGEAVLYFLNEVGVEKRIAISTGEFAFALQFDSHTGEVHVLARADSKETLDQKARSSLACLLSLFQDSIAPGTESFKPFRDEAKNRRRVAKGKKPLQYEWKTVVIEPKAAASTPLGGTHASPRRHERRGHWRNLKSGKQVWVRNCWAGNAALGTVFKDYVVKGDNR